VEYVNQVQPDAEKANKIIELEDKFSNLEDVINNLVIFRVNI